MMRQEVQVETVVTDIRDRLEELLAEMEAATGCPDAQAEELLARWATLERELITAGA